MGVRMRDIAERLGVSATTVSLVLNNKPGAGEELRDRILKTARELGYSPPRLAASGTLCLLHIARHGRTVNRDHDVFLAEYVEGLSHGAKHAGFSLEILNFKPSAIERVLEAALANAADGFIVLGTELSREDVEAFAVLRKPLVFIDTYHDFLDFDFVDMNNDGKVDLLVANDSERNYLYINKGDGTFEDQSYVSGFAFNFDGREIASMGLAVGDYLNNGLIDVLDTDFSDDYKALYRNDGGGNFTDVSREAGFVRTAVPFVGWGDGLFDYDNDGWKDMMMINGHVYPQVDEHDWGTTYAQRPLLFHNNHHGKFEYVPPVKGSGLAVVTPGRGAAFGDLFNNGKIDVVINPVDGPPVLLKNVNADHHHWVELKLVGGPKSPRDAVGATVYLTANGMRQREDVMSGGSFISSNDQRPHFGLGDAADAGTAEIHWPSGHIEKI